MKPIKIASQTYRIGEYVAFKRDDGDWQVGLPLDQDYPMDEGFLAGTVSYHPTLRSARESVYFKMRRAR